MRRQRLWQNTSVRSTPDPRRCYVDQDSLKVMAKKDFHHPFQPYDIQQQFMEALYSCIEDGKVGIFESPTGTGKSLSLICGSLTWLREHKRRMFDDSPATIQTDDEEPEWMLEHARDARRNEMQQARADLETRLRGIRENEKKIREQHANGEPYTKKRRKHTDSVNIAADNEEQFLLDDYEIDQSRRFGNPGSSARSEENAKLMEQLGILHKQQHSVGIDEERDELKVYFCSRTHSQLSQLVGELQRVDLPADVPIDASVKVNSGAQEANHVKQISLGSRKNLCINTKVASLKDQTAINERCMELQHSSTPKEQKCRFLPSKDNQAITLDFRDHALARVRDIEDLVKLGVKLEVCPYYASRPAIGPAEVVTLPYPLLLQKSAREALGISLKDHVVIIDEAHNLMNAIEGIYSTHISSVLLRRAKECLIVYLQKFRNRLKGSNRVYLAQTVRVVDSLLLAITTMDSKAGTGGTIQPMELLSGKGVDQVDLPRLVQYISESKLARKVEGYVAHIAEGEKSTTGRQQVDRIPGTPALTQIQNFVMTLMNPSKDGRFFWSKEAGNCVIRYMLLDPSEHFRDVVEEARAVILAGGTMSPMDDYRQQLFPYLSDLRTFSCGHLIPTSSLLVRTVTSDQSGRLDFSFKSRALSSTVDRVGTAVERLASKVKGGLIIFFPSYQFLDQMCSRWHSSGLMSRIEQLKPLFSDDRNVSAEDTFRAYSNAIASHPARSAVLLSVLGGKLSEGINFSDDLGRCVVVVGLPFPNLDTPEWKAKMKYIDDHANARGEQANKASREYAENMCMRSVNQAIGRVIRHRNDWAGIVLMDGRYDQSRIRSKLPGWIKDCHPRDARGRDWTVDEAEKDVEHFFESR